MIENRTPIVIETSLLTARQGHLELLPTTIKFAAGRHALVGGPEDGPVVLLRCIAGDVKPRRGALSVLGEAPRRVRRRLGYVPLGTTLPDVLYVSELLAIAARLRGDASSSAPELEELGLGALLRRRVDSLDEGEIRAVALAEALGSESVAIVLLEEPFVAMAPPAAAVLPDVIAAPRHAGKCIVVSTASSDDAMRVARDFAVFARGTLLRVADRLEDTRREPRMRVVVADGRSLAAELAKRPEVVHLELSESGVVAAGKDAIALAIAVNAAIIDAKVTVARVEQAP